MNMLWLLIPISLVLGGIGLAAFFWSMGSGQYEDLEGAAQRILFDDDDVPGVSSTTENGKRGDHHS